MSPINFDTMAAKNPEFRRTWFRLSEWFERYPQLKYVDLRRLSRELSDIPTEELALAMQVLVQHGYLRPVYRVESPDGNLIDQDFASPSEIPERMPNRFHSGYFDTSEGDIVPGFRVERVGA